MFALRSLARAAPRSAIRLSSVRTRAIALPTWRTAPAALPAWAPAPRLAAALHLSARRQDNAELVAKLQSEISMEEDMKEDDDLSANIKEYLENSDFEIEDKPGHQEVVLSRTYNDESIRLTFTTADLNNGVPGEELAEDGAMYDDADLDTQSGGANTKGAVAQGRGADGNIRVAPSEQEEVDEDYEDDDQQQGFAAHASIRIDRPGKGTLAIDATAQDGDFLIENVYFFPSADLADPPTAEQEWARRTLYTGPPFNNLDEDLQILLEKYLEDRGINTRLALFIPDYIDHKEQKEYVAWLNKVKSFVE